MGERRLLRGWRRAEGDLGQGLVIFIVLCLPLFLAVAGIAIGFSSIYAQRLAFQHDAQMAATAGVNILTGESNVGYGTGSLGAAGYDVSIPTRIAAEQEAATVFEQQISYDHLPTPSHLQVLYLGPGTPDPCQANQVIQEPSILVSFDATVTGPFLASNLLKVGIVHFHTCTLDQAGVAALTQ